MADLKNPMPEVMDDIPEFTDEELRSALKRMGAEARQQAFAIGRPVMVIEEGQLVLIYRDGTKQVVGPATPATLLSEGR